MMLPYLLAAVSGYLLGSIPTSIWAAKLLHHQDIRLMGSGNPGAGNVYRVYGWRLALFVVCVDIGKGSVAALLGPTFGEPLSQPNATVLLQITAGCAAIAGHCWTIFAGFRGGKGVATAAGLLLVLAPFTFPLCLLVYFLVLNRSGYSSLASILAAASLPMLLAIKQLFFSPSPLPILGFAVAVFLFICWTHRANIRRLHQGTEHQTKTPKRK